MGGSGGGGFTGSMGTIFNPAFFPQQLGGISMVLGGTVALLSYSSQWSDCV